MPDSVLTQTMPLLLAGGVCCWVEAADFAGVRALGVRGLVVFPEFAVAGGSAGVVSDFPASVVDLPVVEFLALVVLPEFAAAVGFSVVVSSILLVLDFLGLDAVFVSRDVAVSAPAGVALLFVVALAAGSVASLFLVLLFLFFAVVAVFSPAAADC